MVSDPLLQIPVSAACLQGAEVGGGSQPAAAAAVWSGGGGLGALPR